MKDYSFRGTPCSKEESNCSCWGVTEAKGPLKRLYFKLPVLLDDEVRLKVLYVGLCHTDASKVDEEVGKNFVYPFVPGHEVIAKIEVAGPMVKSYKPGDIVGYGPFRSCCGMCEFCSSGKDHLCEMMEYKATADPYVGGYATHMHVNYKFLFKIPEKLPLARAAPLLCAGISVFAPLKKWGKPGYRIGIIGMGGLGHLAIQYAAKMGMDVVVISTTLAKEKDALNLGAREFISSKSELAIKKLTTTDKCDIVFNTSYTHDLTVYFAAVKPGGVFIQTAVPTAGKPIQFSNLDLVASEKILAGSNAGSRPKMEETLKFSEDFEVYPIVTMYSWAEFPKAYKIMHDGQAKYRCVVDVAGTFDNL